MRLSAIFTGWFIILKFLFNMEINMFDMNEKITVILGKMLITVGKMSVIAAVVQHPRHFFKIIALIADSITAESERASRRKDRRSALRSEFPGPFRFFRHTGTADSPSFGK
jgi:hypothetical protein